MRLCSEVRLSAKFLFSGVHVRAVGPRNLPRGLRSQESHACQEAEQRGADEPEAPIHAVLDVIYSAWAGARQASQMGPIACMAVHPGIDTPFPEVGGVASR